MKGISWSPMMLRPLESLWSALNRALYLDVAPASEPFKAWRLNRRIMVRHSLLFVELTPPSCRMPPYIETIARRLQFSDAQLLQGVFPVRGFPPPCDGLRYCPRCMEVSFHCVLYQLTALDCCPIHGERLVDHCGHCGSAIDGRLGRPALSCQACGRTLVKNYAVALSTALPGDLAPLRAAWEWVARGHCASLAQHWRVLPTAEPSDRRDALSLMLCLDNGRKVPPRTLRAPMKSICYRARAPLPWASSALDIFATMLRSPGAPGSDPLEDPRARILQITGSWLRHRLRRVEAFGASRIRRLRRALVVGKAIPIPRSSEEKEHVVTLMAISLMREFILQSLIPSAVAWASPPSVVARSKVSEPMISRAWREWTFYHRIGALILALDSEAVALARQFVSIGEWLHRPVMKGRLLPVLETVYNEHDSTRYIAWRAVIPLKVVRPEREPAGAPCCGTTDEVGAGPSRHIR